MFQTVCVCRGGGVQPGVLCKIRGGGPAWGVVQDRGGYKTRVAALTSFKGHPRCEDDSTSAQHVQLNASGCKLQALLPSTARHTRHTLACVEVGEGGG